MSLAFGFALFVVGFAMFGAITYLPQYMQVVRGASPTGSGLELLPLMAGLLLTSMLLHPPLSEQFVLAPLVAFALSALAALFVLEDFPSPACATTSEVKQANVKQTMSLFI